MQLKRIENNMGRLFFPSPNSHFHVETITTTGTTSQLSSKEYGKFLGRGPGYLSRKWWRLSPAVPTLPKSYLM
jgi:hypothetical protein